MHVHQRVGTGVGHRVGRLADAAVGDQVANNVEPAVESHDGASVDSRAVRLGRLKYCVGGLGGAGHGLLDIEHWHSGVRRRNRDLGVRVPPVVAGRSLASGFRQTSGRRADGDDVRALLGYHLVVVVVDPVNAPGLLERIPALRDCVCARDQLDAVTYRARIRYRHVDGTAHATKAHHCNSVRLHFGFSSGL